MAGLGDLVVSLHADTAKFTSDMGRAAHLSEREFAKISRSAAIAGKVIGGALAAAGIAAVKLGIDFISAAANLDDLAEKTGASVEELSKLEQVVRIGGHSMEVAEISLIRLSKALHGADEESKGAGKALAALGLSAEDLRGKDTAEALRIVATELNKYADGSGKSALALDLLGRAGAQALPFLKDLATEQGVATRVTAQQAAQAEELQKALARLKNAVQGVAQSLAMDLVPILTQVMEQMREATTIAGGFASGLALIMRTNALKDFGLDLEATRKQLAGLEEDRARMLRSGPVDVAGLDLAIADAKKRIGLLKFQQQQAALAMGGSDTPGERARMGTGPQVVLDYKPSPGKGASAKSEADKALREAEQAAKALANLVEARSKIVVDAERNAAANRLTVLEHFYRAGFAGEERYWTVRSEIQKQAYDAERAALDAAIKSREADVARHTPKGKAPATDEYHNAVKKLAEAQAKRNQLDAAFNAQGVTDVLARATANKAYEDALKQVSIQLDEINGKAAKAMAARLALQNEPLRLAAEGRDDLEGQILIKNLERAQIAQADFNALRTEAERITTRLGIEEERVQNSLRVGALGELAALQKTGNARRAAADQLEVIVKGLEAVARASENPALILNAEQARAALEKLRGETDLLAQKFNTVLSDSFASAFSDFISGSKNAKEAFASFANSVIRNLSDMYAKQIATGLFGDGKGGGIGGFLAQAFKLFAGASTSGGGMVWGDNPEYASGTNYVPRTELALVHQGEAIIPAGENRGKRKNESEDFGHAISTALDDAIIDFKSADKAVLGLGAQILTVTKPLEKAIGGLDFGSLIESVSNFLSGIKVPAPEMETSFRGFATGTDYVPKTGLYMLHQGEAVTKASDVGAGVTIQNMYQIDSRTDRADIVRMIKSSEQNTLAQVANQTRRGGAYSTAVRG